MLTFCRSAFAENRLLMPAVFLLGLSAHILRAGEPHGNKVYSSRGFEPKPFTTSAALLGIDGWSTSIPPFLNPNAAVITDEASRHGRRSVSVSGGDLVGSGGITSPYDAVGSYRRPLDYNVWAKKPIVVAEADLLLASGALPTSDDFFSMTISARSGDGETLGEIGLSSAGCAVAYGFNAAPGSPPAFVTPITFNAWHRVTMVLDFSGATTTVTYYLDDNLLGAMSTSWKHSGSVACIRT